VVFPGILVSSTNKSDRHDITEILLKVASNAMNHKTIKQTPSISVFGEYNNVSPVTLKRSDASFYNSYFIHVYEEFKDTKGR
jgi:hypothetical protein